MKEDVQARFCDQCGKSLLPLNVPYVSYQCDKCDKVVFIEPPQGTIPAGSRFTIPAGFIKISLRPDSSSQLFKGGIQFVIKRLFAAAGPSNADELNKLFEYYDAASDRILKESPLLAGLDVNSEQDSDEFWKRIKEVPESVEFNAAMRGTAAEACKEAVAEGNAPEAALWMYHAVLAHVMAIFKSEMEESLWRGYLASRIIHESAAAAARTSAEAEAIANLEPLFSRVSESVLHAWVNSGVPIGPRIGVTSLGEEILKPLAEWHLMQRQKSREEERRAREFQMRDPINNISISNSVLGSLNTGTVSSLNVSMEAIKIAYSPEIASTIRQFAEAIAAANMAAGTKNETLENLSFVAEQASAPPEQRKTGVVKAAIARIGSAVSGVTALWAIWQKLEPMLNSIFIDS